MECEKMGGQLLNTRKVTNTRGEKAERAKDNAFRQVLCPVVTPSSSSCLPSTCPKSLSSSTLSSSASSSCTASPCFPSSTAVDSQPQSCYLKPTTQHQTGKQQRKKRKKRNEQEEDDTDDETNFKTFLVEDKKYLAKKIRLLKLQHPDYGIKRIWERLCEVNPTLKFSKVKNRVKNLGLVIQSPGPKALPARFECGECGKSYTRKNGLVRHQRTHSGATPFECSECGKSFGLKTSLLEHMRVHSGDKPFKCLTCARAFKNRSGWRRHVNTHSLEKKYVCPIEGCGQKFCRQFSLTQHLRSLQHNGTEVYMCSLCHKVLSSSVKLKHHMWVHRPRSKSPSSSSISAPPISSSLLSSCALSSSSRLLLSSVCSLTNAPRVFSFQLLDEEDFLREEKLSYLKEDEEEWSDEGSFQLFSSTPSMTSASPFSCIASPSSSLPPTEPTVETASDRVSTQQFPCSVEGCGKAFSHRHVLRKHLLSHSMEAPFLCVECPRSFKSQQALDYHHQHQHQDTGEKERREERGSKHTLRFLICGGGSMWTCSVCQEAFKRKFDLQCHFVSCQRSLPSSLDDFPTSLSSDAQLSPTPCSCNALATAPPCLLQPPSAFSVETTLETDSMNSSLESERYGYTLWGTIAELS